MVDDNNSKSSPYKSSCDAEEDRTESVMGPMVFTVKPPESCTSQGITCIFCDKVFADTAGKNNPLLHHLLIEHQLVIADVAQVCDFKRYCQHWRKRFQEEETTEFCSQININSKPGDVGPKIHYYLLCDSLPEDRVLREELQRHRLEEVLETQQGERSDTHFSRTCLFCKQHFEENRSLLFSHMADDHGFSVGQPDNIVYVNEFLDLLEKTLTNLQCLYCDKTFKDRQTLKDHMRKKQHKKINSQNKDYDKFYIINYLELGKTWEQIQKEDDQEIDVNADNDEWSDWTETPDPVVCLFCLFSSTTVGNLLQHMKDSHKFGLLELKTSLGLDFYGQVKIVNFIRKRVYSLACIYCQEKYQSRDALLEHQTNEQHFRLPDDKSTWDQPQHYFSTYDNDPLLCCLEDDEEDDGNENTKKGDAKLEKC